MTSEDALRRFRPEELNDLAKALRSGRIAWPVTAAHLAPIVGASLSVAAFSLFDAWSKEGLDAARAAWTLELLASSRSQERKVDEMVSLVVTGPDLASTVTRTTEAVVYELFSNAKSSVLACGYAVKQGRQVFKALAERMKAEPALRVRLLLDIKPAFNDTPPQSIVSEFHREFQDCEWPADFPLPELYYYPDGLEKSGKKRSCLHAKFIIVDRSLTFISSANFTEAAQERNIEVGALIRSQAVALQLGDHFDRLISEGAISNVASLL